MGLLDEITEKLGGQQGQQGGLASIQKMIQENGGLQGLAQKLSNGGLGKQVQSWIGSGENQPVSGSQVQQAMDPQHVDQMAQQSGMTREETCDHLAQALPHVVDKSTPQGEMPQQDPLSKGIDALRKILSSVGNGSGGSSSGGGMSGGGSSSAGGMSGGGMSGGGMSGGGSSSSIR